MSITPRRAALAVPLLLVATALNGCGGIADDRDARDVAADVDGTEIQLADFDDLVDGTCDYLDGATAGEVGRFPFVTVRKQRLSNLLQEVAAQHLVEDLDVELSDDYQALLDQVETNYAGLPDDQAAAMVDGENTSAYLSYASLAIGNELLREETGSEPTDQNVIFARGQAELATWLDTHDVELNPTFNLRLDGGALVGDDGISVAVSDVAVSAQKLADLDLSDPDQEAQISAAADSLPEDQVCGPAAT